MSINGCARVVCSETVRAGNWSENSISPRFGCVCSRLILILIENHAVQGRRFGLNRALWKEKFIIIDLFYKFSMIYYNYLNKNCDRSNYYTITFVY